MWLLRNGFDVNYKSKCKKPNSEKNVLLNLISFLQFTNFNGTFSELYFLPYHIIFFLNIDIKCLQTMPIKMILKNDINIFLYVEIKLFFVKYI